MQKCSHLITTMNKTMVGDGAQCNGLPWQTINEYCLRWKGAFLNK